MPFCSKCGTENSNEAQFCQNCGNATQGGDANAATDNGGSNSDVPSLWNPKAAIWWSGLFMPLGPILHYLNWKAMGKDKEAKQAMILAVSFCILILISILTPDNISRAINMGCFFGWLAWGWNLFMGKKTIEKFKAKGKPLWTGKEQVEYVAEKYGTGYKRKSWLVPLAIVFVFYGMIIFSIFSDSSDIGSIFENIGSESEAISIVKKGALQMCPDHTIEELVNASMEKPKWKHTVGENNVDYVNISGLIATGRPTNVMWQFWVRNNTFGTEALELDKEPQNNSAVVLLINVMCNAATVAEQQKIEDAFKAKAAETKKGSFTDSRDGKKYKTVKIGKQTWMAENLNYEAEGSECYDNDPANCKKYGRLYDWETAMKVCPKGWHLPNNAEWKVLITTVGGNIATAGKYLKTKSGWNDKDGKSGNGIDAFGFSALPGGASYSDGSLRSTGNDGLWWASEINTKYDSYYWNMDYESEFIYDGYISKGSLFSVRCLQD